MFCVTPALEFRKSIGGEERILSHNYDLMRRGAALLAESLGTEVMQNEEENLVACMVGRFIDQALPPTARWCFNIEGGS